MVIVCPLPAVCVELPVILSAVAVDGDTDTVNVSPEYVDDIEPSSALITSTSGLSSASYNTIANELATPFEKVTLVPVPKFVLETVGFVPSGEVVAPPNVIVLPPV